MTTNKVLGASKSKNAFKIFLGTMLWSISFGATAGVEVIQSDIYSSTSTEQCVPRRVESQGEYGNGQNSDFNRAVAEEAPLEAGDRAFLDSINISRSNNRWFARARVGRTKVEFRNVSNQSGGSTASVTVPSSTEKLWQISPSFGYQWHYFLAELELLLSESPHYDASPMLSGDTFNLKSRTKLFSLLANLEFEIPTYFAFIPKRLHPYLGAGIGISFKKTDANTYDSTTGNPLSQESKREYVFAWDLGAGLRYDIIGNLLFDLSYRYIDLGPAQIGPIQGDILKVQHITCKGFFLGLVYKL